ncbi:hypothetical protein B9Z55_016119 [Caenorhabditis nigoni]|uniref:Neurotransmitter-gated ion-channel ligand-binding domain-containing protein n=1 Tax=Caenorhabditis nigoni TaxID=1611254 RepID=A0A2G5UDI1_9PELO|nr:hypothetical protein B9Z55_016119 [Caenorhabditis nigoni]
MDLSEGLTLLSMFTLNVGLEPTAAENQMRYAAEQKLRNEILINSTTSMPGRGSNPITAITMLHVDHLRDLDQSKGTMSMSLSFLVTWMDERFRWDPKDYHSVKSVNGDKPSWSSNFWVPNIQIADMPSSQKSPGLFQNAGVEITVESSGTVKAFVRTSMTIPCYFNFGDFPRDFQNCSFTLFSPYYADEFQFNDWSTINSGKYGTPDQVPDTGDFELIGMEARNYYLFLGTQIVENFKGYSPRYCRGFLRYTLMLKRMNKLIPTLIHAPMDAISVFVGLTGILPDQEALMTLISCIGFLMLFAMQAAEVLPDNFNGMPTIGILIMVMMIETILLLSYKIFSIYCRNRKLKAIRGKIEDPFVEQIYKYIKIGDRALMVALPVQAAWNVYLTRNI